MYYIDYLEKKWSIVENKNCNNNLLKEKFSEIIKFNSNEIFDIKTDKIIKNNTINYLNKLK